MDIARLLAPGAIVLGLRAGTKRQALAAIADIASRKLRRPSSEVLEPLVEREAEGSTGVGRGVALPHGRLPGLDRMMAVFVRLDAPVDYDAVDGQPVDLMLALFAPDHAEGEHLRTLARLSRTLRAPRLREHLRQVRTADAALALLSQDASPTAA